MRSRSTSTSRVVKFDGFSRVVRRGPRGSPRTPVRRSARGRGRRAEPLQFVERLALRFLVAGVGERERRLVGTPGLGPARRGSRVVALDLEGVVRVDAVDELHRQPGAAPPHIERPDDHAVPSRLRECVGDLGQLLDLQVAPFEPCGLRARSGGERDTPWFAAPDPEVVRLVERRPGVRVTAARPYEPDRRERRDPGPNRSTRRADDLVDPVDSLVPAALLERAQREPAKDVVPVQLEPVVAVEGKPGPQAAVGLLVAALPERQPDYPLEHACELDQAVRERRLGRDRRPLRTGESPSSTSPVAVATSRKRPRQSLASSGRDPWSARNAI